MAALLIAESLSIGPRKRAGAVKEKVRILVCALPFWARRA